MKTLHFSRPQHLVFGFCLAGMFLLSANWLQAQLINVDFNGNSVGQAYGGGGVAVGPTQAGAALIGSPGDLWNGFDDSAFTFSSYPSDASATGLALTNADGSASGVTLSLTAGGSYNANEPNWGNTSAFTTAGSPYSDLMQDELYTTAPATVTLSGLAANQSFQLVVYSSGDQNLGTGFTEKKGTFTVNGVTQNTVWDGVTSTLINGKTYAEFWTMSDGSGNLVITWGGTPEEAGVNPETDFNGFQLMVVPEPSSLALLGALGMALLGARRRLARS